MYSTDRDRSMYIRSITRAKRTQTQCARTKKHTHHTIKFVSNAAVARGQSTHSTRSTPKTHPLWCDVEQGVCSRVVRDSYCTWVTTFIFSHLSRLSARSICRGALVFPRRQGAYGESYWRSMARGFCVF